MTSSGARHFFFAVVFFAFSAWRRPDLLQWKTVEERTGARQYGMVRKGNTMSDTATSADVHEIGPRRSTRIRTPKSSNDLDGSSVSPPQTSAGGKIMSSSRQDIRFQSPSTSKTIEASMDGVDHPSTEIIAGRDRTRQKRPDAAVGDDDVAKSVDVSTTVGGQDVRSRSKFKGVTSEVGGTNNSSKTADSAGDVETHSDAHANSLDNNNDDQTPSQSHQSAETKNPSVPHGVVAEGGEADDSGVAVEMDTRSSRVETTSVSNAPFSAPGNAKGKGKHTDVSEETSLSGSVPGRGKLIGCTASTGGGSGIGGDGRCFRKVGEKQLLFMLLANPEISPNKESNNNMRERQWKVVKNLITKPTQVEMTFIDKTTRTIMVQLDAEHLTEDKLKHRWQVHRTKYERKAKEYLERIRDPNGFYVEDDTSESLWLAKAVSVWNAAKWERKSRKKHQFTELSGECVPDRHHEATTSAKAEAVATAATAAAATAVVAAEVAKWRAVEDGRSPRQVSEENGVNHCNNGASVGGEGSSESSGISGAKRPLDVSSMEGSKHRRTNGDAHCPDAFVLYENRRSKDHGPSNGKGGSAAGLVVEDVTVPSVANTAAVATTSGPSGIRAGNFSVNGASSVIPPASSCSNVYNGSGRDHRASSTSPVSGSKRGHGESDVPPVVQQLMSLLAQKTEADLEARRVEMDLKRAQTKALWRGDGEGTCAGPSPGQNLAPGRPGRGDVSGRPGYVGLPRFLPQLPPARDLDMREYLSRISAQVEELHTEVSSVRDQNARLREELKETNACVRILVENLVPSSGGLPQRDGAGLLPRVGESCSAWERNSGSGDGAGRFSIVSSLPPAFKDVGRHGPGSGHR